MWSLGSILLEVLSGFPLWLSLKSRIKSLDGRNIINYGIFGVAGRDNGKILAKQNIIFGPNNNKQKLKQILKKGYDHSGNKLFDNIQFNILMMGMLEYDPERRMLPSEVMETEFMRIYAE